MNRPAVVLACLCIFALGACRSAYYSAMEGVLGQQKRHILQSRVKASQRDQKAAQEEFQSTFDLFKQVANYDGGDLERFYRKMQAQLDRSESRAEAVRDRIDSIEQVATDLFAEWKGEIGQISNAGLRRQSQQKLDDTRRRYRQMLAVMHRAEGSMEPVLTAFTDQVLFLKHNLNASAVASLERSAASIEDDVARLVREMQAAIRETEAFLATMEAG